MTSLKALKRFICNWGPPWRLLMLFYWFHALKALLFYWFHALKAPNAFLKLVSCIEGTCAREDDSMLLAALLLQTWSDMVWKLEQMLSKAVFLHTSHWRKALCWSEAIIRDTEVATMFLCHCLWWATAFQAIMAARALHNAIVRMAWEAINFLARRSYSQGTLKGDWDSVVKDRMPAAYANCPA